jgi:hypothetical protein
LLAAALYLAGTAQAADDIQWNGYLNVVGGMLRDQPALGRSAEALPPGRQGYTDQWQFDRQTSAALQARKPLDDRTSVTVQLYAAGDVDNYAANMRWLYLTHALDDTQTLRIGRIGTPNYYFSDFFNVGYAYPWVTPPYEVYTYDSSIDAIDYTVQGYLGATDWTLEAFLGSQRYQVPSPADADVSTHNAWGVIFSTTHDGWLSTRLMLHENTETIVIDGINTDTLTGFAFDAAEEAGLVLDDATRAATAAAMAPALDRMTGLEDFRVRYLNLAIRADLDRWVTMAEAVHYRTGEYLLGSVDSYFASAGYRLGDTLMHLTFGRNIADMDARARADATATGGGLAELFSRAIGSTVASSIATDSRSVTLGARVETSPFTALKVDLTWLREDATLPSEASGIGENWLLRTALNVTF